MKRFVILMLALLPLTAAWADKPVDYVRGPFPFGPMPFFDCTQFDGMDFWIWVEGSTMDEGKMFFGKDGTPIKTVGTDYTLEAISWIPADPNCSTPPITPASCPDPWTQMLGTNTHSADNNAGSAEHTNTIYRDWIFVDPDGEPDTGDEFWWPTWGQISGISLHIGIPGYGNFFAMAGHLTHRLNLQTGQWDVISMTPNWDHAKTKDVYAYCSYLGNQ